MKHLLLASLVVFIGLAGRANIFESIEDTFNSVGDSIGDYFDNLNNYLSEDNVDLSQIPDPPDEGSAADLKDLEETYNIVLTREEPTACALAKADAPLTYNSFFNQSLSDAGIYLNIDANNARKLIDLYNDVFHETERFVKLLKNRWERQRPYERHEGIKSKQCVFTKSQNAYPSGHSAISQVLGLVLSEIAPQFRAQFLARSNEIAMGRVKGGVHHLKDIQAGQKLGKLIFEALMQNPAFKSRVISIRDIYTHH